MSDKINLEQKFGLFEEQWSPKIVASLNGQEVKIAKVEGTFVWHQHDDEDELFYVIKGQLQIDLRDTTIVLHPGEMYVVPRGLEHRPRAEQETWIMRFEPAATKHTGNTDSALTIESCERI